MTVFVLAVIAGVSFLVGFFLGNAKPQIQHSLTARLRFEDRDLEKLMEEYRNFLSYDGSEQ